jgi:hypothetical protein
MTCRDFQHKWDELLDADARRAASPDADGPGSIGADRVSPADDREALLLAHAAECPACRPIAARYQVLRHAIRVWRQPPLPPADLMHRILSAPADPTPRTWEAASRRARRSWRDHRSKVSLRIGIAAAMVACMLLGVTLVRITRRDRTDRVAGADQTALQDLHSISGPETAPANSTAFNRALAEATSATWDLARSASEPAARISRDVLDATTQGDSIPNEAAKSPSSTAPTGEIEGLASLSVRVPSLDPLAPNASTASTVLQQVGDQLSAGVRPLSSTARHAFGFLLGPARDRTEPRTTERAERGA